MSTWVDQIISNNRGTIFFQGEGQEKGNLGEETASSMAGIGDLNGDGVRWNTVPRLLWLRNACTSFTRKCDRFTGLTSVSFLSISVSVRGMRDKEGEMGKDMK